MIIFTQNFCVFMIARQSVKTFSKKRIAIVTLAEGEMRQYNENKRERERERELNIWTLEGHREQGTDMENIG